MLLTFSSGIAPTLMRTQSSKTGADGQLLQTGYEPTRIE
jgi:hypothetical protein